MQKGKVSIGNSVHMENSVVLKYKIILKNLVFQKVNMSVR